MRRLPGGWRRCTIAELGEVRGGRQRSPHHIDGEERPYLRVANVLDGWIDTSDVLRMRFTDREYREFKLEVGDILLNEGQSLELVGRSAVYRGDPPDCCFQNTVIRFRSIRGTSPEFARALFEYLMFKGRFAAVAARTTSIAHLGTSRFASIRVACPSDPTEQLAIGCALAQWDEVIEQLDQLAAAKRRFRRGLTQELLTGKRRFEEFGREMWSERHLGDLFTERIERERADLPLLSITADRGVIPRDQLERRDTSNDDKSAYLRIAPGDIGYNTMRMWQGVSALSNLEGLVSPAYTICVPGADVCGSFAAQLFKLPRVVDAFRRYSQGLVDDTLNLKFHHFAQIRVKLPELAEQQKIAEVLDALDREIALLTQLRDALDRQRKGVAELLLTGTVRMPELAS